MTQATRPGVVTFIGVLLYIKAALAAAGALGGTLAILMDDIDLPAGFEDSTMWVLVVVEVVLAIVFAVLAQSLMAGSTVARAWIAFVVGFQLFFVVLSMIMFHDGGHLAAGGVVTVFGLFILWALYGDDRSEEYFNSLA